MSMFDRPGALEAIYEWTQAREARVEAQKAYRVALVRNSQALVRMANAHKKVVEVVGAEYADLFPWLESLDGNRDQIIDGANAAQQASA